jgi:hypothetical protein
VGVTVTDDLNISSKSAKAAYLSADDDEIDLINGGACGDITLFDLLCKDSDENAGMGSGAELPEPSKVSIQTEFQ